MTPTPAHKFNQQNHTYLYMSSMSLVPTSFGLIVVGAAGIARAHSPSARNMVLTTGSTPSTATSWKKNWVQIKEKKKQELSANAYVNIFFFFFV